MNQDYINLIIGACGLLSGAIIKSMWDAVKDLQKADKELIEKVSEIEILVAGNYVKREYFDNIAHRFEGKLDKIFDIIATKADK